MRALWAILIGGAVAGAFDITYAILANGARGVPAAAVLQSVASGLLGRQAYAGGAETAALGLGLHFAMTMLMAAGFVAMIRLVPALLRYALAAGAIYGLFLLVLMRFVVAPLSAASLSAPEGWRLAGALFAHVALVGLPIAFTARRFLSSSGRQGRTA